MPAACWFHKLEGTWFDRTADRGAQRRRKPDQPEVKENDFKTVEVLELSPLPCLTGEKARELKKSPAPRFHAFTKEARQALRDAYFAFAAAFQVASERLRGGDRPAVFPEGCFPPALPFYA